MSALPEVPREEIYKSLYEKATKENTELREQVTTMEILATKLRDERDDKDSKLTEALANVAQRDELLRSLREPEAPETIEGEILED